MERATVYVRVLDEGVANVWRPATAADLGDGRYELIATDDYYPTIETWEFPPGIVVAGEPYRAGGGIRVTRRADPT
jgi:hypothetical protein